MDLEDFVEPEVAIAAAVTAVALSPPARRLMRRGLVYGLAGVLMAGDVLSSFARGVSQGVQQGAAEAGQAANQAAGQATPEANAPAATTAG